MEVSGLWREVRVVWGGKNRFWHFPILTLSDSDTGAVGQPRNICWLIFSIFIPFSEASKDIEEFVEDCDRILRNTFEHDLDRYEQFLQDWKHRLSPTHYVMLTVKKFLGDLYGNAEGYSYGELTRERMENKIKFLEEFKDTIEKVDPGCTKVIQLGVVWWNRKIIVDPFRH